MCYVSAEGRSRDAREDEVLVVSRQPHGSNWLVSLDDISIAVCLKHGTEVELLYIPKKTQRQFGVQQEARARFRMGYWWWRRDVFVLDNGRKAQLQKLQSEQVVRVLSVPGTSDREAIPVVDKKRPDPVAEVGHVRRYHSKRDRSRGHVL